MGGFFGAVSRKNCKYDVFFGTDYHSHLGTRRGGMVIGICGGYQMLGEIIGEAVAEHKLVPKEKLKEYVLDINCPLPPRLMYNFSRLRDLSLVMSKSILDEFALSDFRIIAMEQSISDRKSGAFKPMEIRINSDENAPVVSLGSLYMYSEVANAVKDSNNK